ncbi:hypothetical protein [Chryseobacterium sp. KMC2]|uniref:hypothetical protein n=1 Tax=Chryseobacterium sp. KMC2 TaxID=2800705 RepID=UPI001924F572|nr:hypothetical protein [Chryseobacterium sp. KMC2]MBL3547555.1 hypothetical protein [Chryseobacterium sp. KMC2]
MQDQFNKILQEFLENKNITNNKVNTASVLLFKEYLKRMHVWYEKLNMGEKWFFMYRLDEAHNIVHFVDSHLLDSVITLEDFRKTFDIGMFYVDNKGLDIPILYGYICWELFKEYPQFNKYKDLPDPYEPVIKILKRGNNIRRGEMKSIEINGQVIFKDLDFTKNYLPSFDDEFLNYLDNNCERLADKGIPNSEKIQDMWKEFREME